MHGLRKRLLESCLLGHLQHRRCARRGNNTSLGPAVPDGSAELRHATTSQAAGITGLQDLA